MIRNADAYKSVEEELRGRYWKLAKAFAKAAKASVMTACVQILASASFVVQALGVPDAETMSDIEEKTVDESEMN